MHSHSRLFYVHCYGQAGVGRKERPKKRLSVGDRARWDSAPSTTLQSRSQRSWAIVEFRIMTPPPEQRAKPHLTTWVPGEGGRHPQWEHFPLSIEKANRPLDGGETREVRMQQRMTRIHTNEWGALVASTQSREGLDTWKVRLPVHITSISHRLAADVKALNRGNLGQRIGSPVSLCQALYTLQDTFSRLASLAIWS